jgi:threonine dehydrogenase-like Zn-dependent dehydrogenase
MKAWVFYEPGKHVLETVPDPKPGPDQVLVRVKACGICGSDVAYHYGKSSLETPDGKGPCILGHEYSGEVVEVGDMAKHLFAPGDRVVLDPVQYCNACSVCKRAWPNLCENKQVLGVSTNGGFAELSVSHFTGVHRLPASVDYVQGALCEPIACASYGIQNLGIQLGNSVAILGMGAIGQIMLQLAKASGAAPIYAIEVQGYRLDLAAKHGADVLVNPGDPSSPHYTDDLVGLIQEATGGMMLDRAIVATGSVEAMESALAVTGRRSTIVYFGLPADTARVSVPALQSILWDKTIRFSWLAPNMWPKALDALAGGLIDTSPLVSKTIPLEELLDGLAEAKDSIGNPMKIVVTPS